MLASESVSTSVSPTLVHQDSEPVTSSSRLSLDQYKLICRNGFADLSDAARVPIATTKALIVVNRIRGMVCARVSAMSEQLTAAADMANVLACGQMWIKDIQNLIELLRHSGEHGFSGLKKGKSFFKTRVTEDQAGSALSWDCV